MIATRILSILVEGGTYHIEINDYRQEMFRSRFSDCQSLFKTVQSFSVLDIARMMIPSAGLVKGSKRSGRLSLVEVSRTIKLCKVNFVTCLHNTLRWHIPQPIPSRYGKNKQQQ